MGFFENLGKKASAAYDATAEKTGKIAKEAKLKGSAFERFPQTIIARGAVILENLADLRSFSRISGFVITKNSQGVLLQAEGPLIPA